MKIFTILLLAALSLIAPAREILRCVPTFNSCGVYFTPEERLTAAPQMEFRASGAPDWTPALTPVPAASGSQWRGSLVKLEEDTPYEVRLRRGERILAQTGFRTWSSQVPIGRTVILNAENFRPGMVIRDRGSSKGYVRYAGEPGFVLKGDAAQPVLTLRGATNVILDGLNIQGGGRNAVVIEESRDIRIVNCEISGWGRSGAPRYDRKGQPHTSGGERINCDGGIRIRSGNEAVVVERCYIHSPRNRANSWYYAHPAGPEAIMVERPSGPTVLRYNDLVGSDLHRWNDAVEGAGNFDDDGGFNRDADIYGNFMIFANDDCIELDGGQCNVRCFWNRFEGALCGVSIQGCMCGPSYVFENRFSGMGDEFGAAGQTIKTGGGPHGPDATSFIFSNTLTGPGAGIWMRDRLKAVVKNNLMTGRNRIRHLKTSPQSEVESNSIEHPDPDAPSAPGNTASAVPNFTVAGAPRGVPGLLLPLRPLPVELSCDRFEFKPGSPDSVEFTAAATAANFEGRFQIRINPGLDWFSVTPASGVLRSERPVRFTIRIDRSKLTERRNWRAAFLLRFANGLSRPASLYVENTLEAPAEPARPGEFALYQDAGAEFYPGAPEQCYTFDLPRPGRYYFMIYGRSGDSRPELLAAVNSDEFAPSIQQVKPFRTWTMLTPGCRFGGMLRHYDLPAGRHTVRLRPLRKKLSIEKIAVTDSPGSFEFY